MNRLHKINPIIVTGAERSGSTLIARILDMCGVFSGNCNGMFENRNILKLHHYLTPMNGVFPETSLIDIPVGWQDRVLLQLQDDGWKGEPWMVKGSKLAQYWSIWHYSFPDAKWLLIRRKTGDVIQSCVKTGYMKTFKNPVILKEKGFSTEEEGWIWWIHQYEKKFIELIAVNENTRVIWPDRMVSGDYQQMMETVEWLGLKWNDKIPEVISPLLEKSRRKMEWQQE